MASADIRAAVASFFQAASIPGLSRVFRAPPYWADGGDWSLDVNLGSAAVGAIHLSEDDETRITVPIQTGQKIISYKVGLMLFYQWLIPSAGFARVDEDAWTDPLDIIIDGCKALLRADPNCGIPATVWQAGQDPNDLKVIRDIPRRTSGAVLTWNVLEFSVHEIVTA